MRKNNLSSLDELGKLKMAIECMEQSVPFPTVISDFLVEHGLYELITNPKVRYVPPVKKHSTRKPRVRKRT